MAVLRSLVTTLGLNSAQYREELKRAQKSTSAFASKLKSIGSASSKALSGMTSTVFNLKTALVAVGSGAALYGIKQAYDNADAIRRQGEMVGMAADEWGRYTYAARIAGVDNEQLGDVFKDLGVKITDAAKTGAGPMVDFFTQINQSAADWAAMSPEEQFRRFAEELNKMSDSDARFYLDEINDSAFSLFETLKTGDLLRLADEAEQLGLSLTQAQFDNISDTRRELETLAATGTGVWQQVIAAAAPAVAKVSEGIRGWIVDQAEAAGGFQNLGIVIVETILKAVIEVAEELEDLLNATYQGAEKLAAMMGKTLNPQRPSMERHLQEIEQQIGRIHQEASKMEALGDAPPMVLFTDEEQAKVDKLTAAAAKIRQELNESFNFAAGFSAETNNVIAQIRAVKTEVATPANQPVYGSAILGGGGGETGTGEDPQVKMRAELELIRQKYASEQELLLEKTLIEQETLIAAEEAKLISEQESQALRKQSWGEYYDSVNREAEDSANKQAQAQAKANATMAQMQQQVMQQALGLIKATAEEGSGLWMAALITEKGIAVAQALIHAEVASAKALAEVPYPANLAVSAKMKMLGYASAALIAATGVAEIAGAKAAGGSVASGRTYLVGERGPELFTAGATGQITSNENLSKAMGNTQNPNWQVIINEAPPGTTASVNNEARIVEIAVGQAKAEIEGDVRRGGNSMASTFEESYGLNRAWGI